MKRAEAWARVSIAALVLAMMAVGVYFGLPIWAALLLAIIGIALNGWLLAFEDRQPGGIDDPEGR